MPVEIDLESKTDRLKQAIGCDPRTLREGLLRRIFTAYSLSMIPQWRSALAKAISLLATGGELHVVDFGGQVVAAWFQSTLRNWLTLFHVTRRHW